MKCLFCFHVARAHCHSWTRSGASVLQQLLKRNVKSVTSVGERAFESPLENLVNIVLKVVQPLSQNPDKRCAYSLGFARHFFLLSGRRESVVPAVRHMDRIRFQFVTGFLFTRCKATDDDVCIHFNMPGGNGMAGHADFEAAADPYNKSFFVIPGKGQ